MDIKDLRIFARVAAVQNLTQVAGALGVSAGTVSKRIQSLEEELGVRLIDRTTRSSRLTEEGRMFLERAERILAEIDLAQDEISASSGRPAGRLAISAPASLSRQIVNPAMLSFVEAYPDIEVRVDISDHVSNLHEQGYDAAIRVGALPDSTLKAKRLVSDRVILVAAPRYVERKGAPQKPEDLAAHDCLIHGDQRTWTFIRGPVSAASERVTVRAAGRLLSDSGDFLLTAALRGAGLMRTSEIAAREEIAAGRLVRVLPEYVLAADAAIWAVYPNAKHAMPRLRALLDHLAGWCKESLEAPLTATSVRQPAVAGAERDEAVARVARNRP